MGEQYFIIDGPNRYGPADLATLNQWAAEGRLHANMMFEELSTSRRLRANEIPGLNSGQAAPAQDVLAPQPAPQVEAAPSQPQQPYAAPAAPNYGQQYAQPPGSNYYRPGQPVYGRPDQLQALADGYFGLNTAFLLVIVLYLFLTLGVPGILSGVLANNKALVLPALIFIFLAYGGGVALLALKPCKKIAYGKGWTEGQGVLAAVLVGLNAMLCCGIIGFIVMQTIASSEIKKYGVPSGIFGLKKSEVARVIAAMEQRPR